MSTSGHHRNNNTAHFEGGLRSRRRRGSEREHETGYDTSSYGGVKEPVGGHSSIPERGLTAHANAPPASQSASFGKACLQAECTDKARARNPW